MKLFTTALLIIRFSPWCKLNRSQRHEKCKRHEWHNYIIERQEAGLVQGVPTMRRIIGKREIDIYSDGSMSRRTTLSVTTNADLCGSRCL